MRACCFLLSMQASVLISVIIVVVLFFKYTVVNLVA